MGRVHDETEGSLRERLGKGVRQAQTGVGDGRTEMVLQEIAHPRLGIDQRRQRRQFDRDRGEPEHLPKDAGAQPEHIGGQGHGFAPGRLGVGRMFRPIVRERLLGYTMSLLERLDHLEDVGHRRPLGIEGHHHAAQDRVHLAPRHTLEFVEATFEGLDQVVVSGTVHGPHLDRCPPGRAPHPSATTSGAHAGQRVARHRAQLSGDIHRSAEHAQGVQHRAPAQGRSRSRCGAQLAAEAADRAGPR